MRNSKIITWIHDTLGSPYSLQHLCRARVRTSIRQKAHAQGLGNSIDLLPVPRKIKQYLLFRQETAGMTSSMEDYDESYDDSYSNEENLV